MPRRPGTSFFFFNDTATTEIYTLSLHDALPIFCGSQWGLLAGLVPALILFPTFLLSSMAGVSSMAILHGTVIVGFLRKPLLFPVFFLASSVLADPKSTRLNSSHT